MKLDFPKKYHIYIKEFVSCGYAENENEVVKKLFEGGLDEVLFDAYSLGAPEPDMMPSFPKYLKKYRKKLSFELPDSFKDLDKIKALSELWAN
jgi:pyruvate formate-lyase activating enzyme-like uncharacterized protein